MKLLGFETTSFRHCLHRRLEMLVVFHYLMIFLLSPLFCILIPIYLILFTSYWWIVIIYAVWFYYDRDAPKYGSRRSEWLRHCSIWRFFADYFPVKLIKTSPLSPERNYVFACHPHGILCMGVFASFATESNGFSQKFPKIKTFPSTLAGQFYFPLRREYCLMLGSIEVTQEAIKNVLQEPNQGHAVLIIVGGAREILRARPNNNYDLVLNKRRGFIRTAMINGADLVPVISFGENELFEQCEYGPKSAFYTKLQDFLKRTIGYPVPWFYGRGMLNYCCGFLPYRRPVFTVVGSPIRVEKCENPTRRQINRLHSQYVIELRKLFDEHKLKYGVVSQHTQLNIVH